jgi:hypothetical protein
LSYTRVQVSEIRGQKSEPVSAGAISSIPSVLVFPF